MGWKIKQPKTYEKKTSLEMFFTDRFTNDRDRVIYKVLLMNYSRYPFDTDLCAKGWKQYDTDQDASYFGVWTNNQTFEIASYCEGDFSVVLCEDPEGFKKELDHMAAFYGDPPPAFTVIAQDGQVTAIYDTREGG